MKRSDTLGWSQLKIGIVLVVGFLILLWVAFNSNLGRMFESKRDLRARLSDAQGLVSGAPVFFLGMQAGKVTSLSYDPAGGPRPIAVTLEVREDFRRSLRSDAWVTVSAFGVIGDKFLALERGSAARALPEGAVLKGRAEVALTELLEPGRDALQRVDSLLADLEDISGGLAQGEGSLGKLLARDDVHDMLVATLEETRSTLAGLRQTQRDLGSRLASTSGAVASAASSFDSLAAGWRRGDGTLNRLAEDPSLYQNLDATTARLDRVLAEVERGDGLFARLLKDPELADQVTGLVVDLRALLQDMRENPAKYVQFSVF